MSNVLIAGGTGLIGRALQKHLGTQGFQVNVLTRKPTDKAKGLYHWDPQNKVASEEPFIDADYIINLAGANIGDGRLSKKKKEEILNSRINATRLIGSMLRNGNKVKAVIQASAFGYYGNGLGEVLEEDSMAGSDFFAHVCQEWEAEADKIKMSVPRLIIFRFGHVLDDTDGFLPRLMSPLKYNIIALFGEGKQHVPWIHRDDVTGIIEFAIKNGRVAGTYNACAPEYTTLRSLMTTAADCLNKNPLKFRVPKPVLQLALGELADTLYYDAKLSSKKIENRGFEFKYPDSLSALKDLLC